MMKTLVPILIALILTSCASTPDLTPATHVDEYLRIATAQDIVHETVIPDLRAMCHRIATNFPITVGMSMLDVRAIVAKSNPETENTTHPTFVFLEPSEETREYMSYFAVIDDDSLNGMNSFWVDIALHNKKVKNIYIVPGNASVLLLPGFRLAGEGKWVGKLQKAIMLEMKR